MNTEVKKARLAGLLYLLVIVFGMFAELYVRAELFVIDDVAETAKRITENRGLFRLGFVSDLMMQLSFFFLPLPLYQLFKTVNKNAAMIMVLCVEVSVAIMCLNMLHQLAATRILEQGTVLTAYSPQQLHTLAYLFLDLQKQGYRIAQLFFGLWLLPLGYLVCKSSYMPKLIGQLLIVAGISFMTDFFLFFLSTNYRASLSSLVTLPTVVGEFAFCLWLLIKGVRTPKALNYASK